MMDLPKTYPAWVFDDSPIEDPLGYGERAVNFIRHLKHPKSSRKGKGFVLDPWQERIVRRIYAPRHKDGSRIVKTVFAMIPRGNRKTSIGAALTLLHTIGPERMNGGQAICAAADRKQARIAFEEAIGIIREDRRLVPLIEAQDYRNRLTDKRSHSILEAISADAKLNLNIWLDNSTDPFIDMTVYDKTAEAVATPEGGNCWIGVDMSSTTDLTAVVACIVDAQDNYHILPFFFVPADNLRAMAERDGVPYPLWADEGFITPTDGNVIDYRAVEHCIRDLCTRFNVREIGFDPAYAQPVMSPLLDDGFPVVTIRQGWVTQSPALNELERVILSGRFFHGGNPVLRWCFDNVAIHTDSAGNRTMHKGKSTDRIDGAAAAWMTVSRASSRQQQSVYNSDHWSDEMAFFLITLIPI